MTHRRILSGGAVAAGVVAFLLQTAVAQDLSRPSPSSTQQSTKVLLRASHIVGHDVFGTQGDKLGDIQDLAIDKSQGRVSYVLLDLDRMSDKLVAIPISRLSFDYKGNGSWGIALKPEDVAALDRLPSVKEKDWNTALGHEFAESVRSRFSSPVERDIDRGEKPVGMREDRPSSAIAPLHRAEKLVGLDLRNRQNEDLGEIEDLLINPATGRVEFAVCATGGFLGINENLQPVPLQSLDIQNDKAVLNIDKARLKSAPSFDRKSWPSEATDDLGRRVYTYYEAVYVSPSDSSSSSRRMGEPVREPRREDSRREDARENERDRLEPGRQEPARPPQEPVRDPAAERDRTRERERDRVQDRDTGGAPPMAIRASQLDRKAVYGTQSDKLGDVKEVIIDPAQRRVAYGRVDFDRINDKLVAIPIERLKLDRKSDGSLGIAMQQPEAGSIDKLPSVNDNDWNMAMSADFLTKVRAHYGTVKNLETERPVAARDDIVRPTGGEGLWRASKLAGSKITTNLAEDVGEIEDVLVDPATGKAKVAVVSTGGVLGVGEKLHPVPIELIRFPSREGDKIVVNADKNKLKNAPTFGRNEWPGVFDKDFCHRVHSYYGVKSDDRDEGREKNDDKR